MKQNIIGILGRSRVGKDTTARILRDTFGSIPFEICHIAKPLKDSMMAMYQFSEDQLHGNLKDVLDMRYGHSPRELCAIWNHKLSHMHGPKFLIHQFFEAHSPHNFPNIIIPDVRFCHDCYEIRRRGGLLLKIVRSKFPLQLDDENHIDRLTGDVTIANDSDIETLQNKILEQVVPLIKA
jgi:dephospho-CoA kinase